MLRLLPVCALLVTLLADGRDAAAQRLTGPHPAGPLPDPVVLDHVGRFEARLAQVGSDVYVAGQPTEAALRELHREGVTTIVNLRTPVEMKERVPFDEAAVAASLGITYVWLPVRGNAEYPYTPETVRRFARAMESTHGKLLLHCTVAWRASHLWAAYAIAERGVPVDTALAQARAINLMDEMHDGTNRQPVEDFLGRELPALRRPESH